VPFVYILRCADGTLYTGSAMDLKRRVGAHASGKASKYTRSRRPVALAWSCRVRDWRRALRLEWHIKRLDREEKLAIVSGSRRPPPARPRAHARARRPGPAR
jgi:putative endonuclease